MTNPTTKNDLRLPLRVEEDKALPAFSHRWTVLDAEDGEISSFLTYEHAQAIVTAVNNFDKAVELLGKTYDEGCGPVDHFIGAINGETLSDIGSLLQSIREQKK